jgi:hypothetical protein
VNIWEKEKRGLIDSGPVMGELKTASRYEAFIREGAKTNYRAESHLGDCAPFLEPERFAKKIAKETILAPVFRRLPLKNLLKRVSAKAKLPSDILLRKDRLANVVQARDRFIREVVLEQGYLASLVAKFLVCHPSNVSRAL